jgi:hypothetical protein
MRGVERDGAWKKLRLSALTMRRDNETLRDQIRNLRSVIAPNKVQHHI